MWVSFDKLPSTGSGRTSAGIHSLHPRIKYGAGSEGADMGISPSPQPSPVKGEGVCWLVFTYAGGTPALQVLVLPRQLDVRSYLNS